MSLEETLAEIQSLPDVPSGQPRAPETPSTPRDITPMPTSRPVSGGEPTPLPPPPEPIQEPAVTPEPAIPDQEMPEPGPVSGGLQSTLEEIYSSPDEESRSVPRGTDQDIPEATAPESLKAPAPGAPEKPESKYGEGVGVAPASDYPVLRPRYKNTPEEQGGISAVDTQPGARGGQKEQERMGLMESLSRSVTGEPFGEPGANAFQGTLAYLSPAARMKKRNELAEAYGRLNAGLRKGVTPPVDEPGVSKLERYKAGVSNLTDNDISLRVYGRPVGTDMEFNRDQAIYQMMEMDKAKIEELTYFEREAQQRGQAWYTKGIIGALDMVPYMLRMSVGPAGVVMEALTQQQERLAGEGYIDREGNYIPTDSGAGDFEAIAKSALSSVGEYIIEKNLGKFLGKTIKTRYRWLRRYRPEKYAKTFGKIEKVGADMAGTKGGKFVSEVAKRVKKMPITKATQQASSVVGLNSMAEEILLEEGVQAIYDAVFNLNNQTDKYGDPLDMHERLTQSMSNFVTAIPQMLISFGLFGVGRTSYNYKATQEQREFLRDTGVPEGEIQDIQSTKNDKARTRKLIKSLREAEIRNTKLNQEAALVPMGETGEEQVLQKMKEGKETTSQQAEKTDTIPTESKEAQDATVTEDGKREARSPERAEGADTGGRRGEGPPERMGRSTDRDQVLLQHSRRIEQLKGKSYKGQVNPYETAEVSEDLLDNPDWEDISQRAEKLGYTAIPVKNSGMRGWNDPSARVIAIEESQLGSEDMLAPLHRVLFHELFHDAVMAGDTAAKALMDSVDYESEVFKAFKEIYLSKRMDEASRKKLEDKGEKKVNEYVAEEFLAEHLEGKLDLEAEDGVYLNMIDGYKDVATFKRYAKELVGVQEFRTPRSETEAPKTEAGAAQVGEPKFARGEEKRAEVTPASEKARVRAELDALAQRNFPFKAQTSIGEHLSVLGPAGRFSPYKEDAAAKGAKEDPNQLMVEDADGKRSIRLGTQLYEDGKPLITRSQFRGKPFELPRFARPTAQDAEYLELAKDPKKNKAKLQAMVDEAAKKAGYTIKAFHGTDEKFTTFKKGRQSARGILFSSIPVETQGFFFATERGDAEEFGKYIVPSVLRMENPLVDPERDKALAVDKFDSDKEEEIAYILTPMFEKKGDDWIAPVDLGIREVYAEEQDLANEPDAYSQENRGEVGYSTEWIYEFMSPEGMAWDVLDNPEVVRRMEELGYDGTYVEESFGSSIFVPDSNQIKSADPVTYDDQGNVIPLSKRFDKRQDDIRYALAGIEGGINPKAYVEARQMEDAGETRLAIWQKTGLWKSEQDGKWRMEINPDEMLVKSNPIEAKTLGDMIAYAAFFEAYPLARDIEVRYSPNARFFGQYLPGDIDFTPDGPKWGRQKGRISYGPNADIADSTAHELAHFVQQVEGYGKGGTLKTAQIVDRTDRDKQVTNLLKLERKDVRDELKKMDLPAWLKKVYRIDVVPEGRYGSAMNISLSFTPIHGDDRLMNRNLLKTIKSELRKQNLLRLPQPIKSTFSMEDFDERANEAKYYPTLTSYDQAINMRIEGWQRILGGDAVDKLLKEETYEIAPKNSVLRDTQREVYRLERLQRIYRRERKFKGYQILPGEAEARMMQERSRMSEEERREGPPWETMENMLRSEGIVGPQQTMDDVNIRYALSQQDGPAPVSEKQVDPPEIFRSPMYDTFKKKLPGSVNGPQLVSLIETWTQKGDLKKEEVMDTGILDWARELDSKTSKDDVLAEVEQRTVPLGEVVKGEVVEGAPGKDITWLSKDGAGRVWLKSADGELLGHIIFDDDSYQWYAFNREGEELHSAGDRDGAKEVLLQYLGVELGRTKYSEYQLPGGENYKEMLITVPAGADNAPMFSEWWKTSGIEDRMKALAEYQKQFPPKDKTQYKSSHWDEPNVVVHVRFNERMVDGKKVLFLEEIQSDWNQDGRKKGYKERARVKEPDQYTIEVEKRNGKWWARYPEYSSQWLASEDTRAMATQRAAIVLATSLTNARERGVPDAPFKKSWPLLAFKRMARYAVDNGFDMIGWTPGQVQADRYDLSKQIEMIEYQKTGDNDYFIRVKDKRGQNVMTEYKQSPSDLEDKIGKEITQKIVNGEGRKYDGEEETTLQGLDLKVGGEGMIGFYDQILPKTVNKYVKRWGSKVRPMPLFPAVESEPGVWYPVSQFGPYADTGAPYESKAEADAKATKDMAHTLPITDKMRESIQTEPQLRYARPEASQDLIKVQIKEGRKYETIPNGPFRISERGLLDVVDKLRPEMESATALDSGFAGRARELLAEKGITGFDAIALGNAVAMMAQGTPYRVIVEPEKPETGAFPVSYARPEVKKQIEKTVGVSKPLSAKERVKKEVELDAAFRGEQEWTATELRMQVEKAGTDDARRDVIWDYAKEKLSYGEREPVLEILAKEKITDDDIDRAVSLVEEQVRMRDVQKQAKKDAKKTAQEKLSEVREQYRTLMKNSRVDLRHKQRMLNQFIDDHLPPDKRDRFRRRLKRLADFVQQDAREKYMKESLELIEEVGKEAERNIVLKQVLRTIDKEQRALTRGAKQGKKVSMDTTQAEALREYLAGLTGMNEKKEARLRASLEYMEKNPEAELPESVLRDISNLAQQNVYQMSVKELSEVLDNIKQLKSQGMLKSQIKERQRQRELLIEVQEAVAAMNKAGLSERETPLARAVKAKPSWKDKARAVADLARNAGWSEIRPERMAYYFEGYDPEGPFSRNTFMKAVEAENAEIRGKKAAYEKFVEMFKDIDITAATHAPFITIETDGDNIDISLSQAMFMVAQSKSPGGMAHVRGTLAEDIAPEDMDDVISDIEDALPEEAKDAMNAWFEYAREEQYDRINDVFKREHHVSMPKVDNYLRIDNIETPRAENAIVQDMLQRISTKTKASVSKGFTLGRVNSKAPFVEMDFFKTVARSMMDAEHYIAWNDRLREINQFLSNPDIKDAMRRRSEEASKQFNQWLKDTALGRFEPSTHPLDKLSDFLRMNSVSSILAANISSIAIQPVSVLTGARALDNPKGLLNSVGRWIKNPVALTKKVQEKSAMMTDRGRSYEREISELYQRSEMQRWIGGIPNWDQFRDFMMSGQRITDQMTTTILWDAKYREALDSMIGDPDAEQKAIAEADKLIRTTQPMGGIMHLPTLLKGRGIKKAFTTFKNQINQNKNLVWEIGSNYRGIASSAMDIFWYVLAPALLVFIIRHGRLPKDEREIADAITGQFLGANPVEAALVTAMNAKVFGKSKSDRWANDFTPLTFAPIADLSQGIMQDNLGKQVDAGARMLGVPGYTQARRTYKGIKEYKRKDDPRYLIWSKYRLED